MVGNKAVRGSKNKARPDFLIVGAARAGTTSLYYWLKQHPEVFMPDIKEPSYFVHGYGISDWEKYLSLFEPGRGKKAIGEASAAYLAAPESPRWIREILGDVKIIILLRNPVERAWSLYCWMVMEGYEWISNFEQALAEEEKRFNNRTFRQSNPEYFWDYMYFRSGLYYEQVKRYIDLFGENVRVYLFDDLINLPKRVYADICNFLGINESFSPTFTPQNPSRVPRVVALQFAARRLQIVLGKLPRGLRRASRLIPLLMTLNVSMGYKASTQPDLKKRLQDDYREDIAKLSELIQRDLSGWLC